MVLLTIKAELCYTATRKLRQDNQLTQYISNSGGEFEERVYDSNTHIRAADAACSRSSVFSLPIYFNDCGTQLLKRFN
jgi:hypothetical protein